MLNFAVRTPEWMAYGVEEQERDYQRDMRIVMIGAGNLATNLGKALHGAGHDFVQVYSRTMEAAEELAKTVGGAATNDIGNLVVDADVYILAIKDSAMADIIPQACKGREQRVFLHTAGSMPMDTFEGMALHYGVLYPLQTFTKSREVDFSGIPIFVEANDGYAAETIVRLAESISHTIYPLSSEDRQYLHLAAVFACNFANCCYDMAAYIMEKRALPFRALLPLIDETTLKVHEMTPAEAQTGPAVRYDENVIRAQSMMLRDNPLLKDIYERMSVNIHKRAQELKKKRRRGGQR